MSAYIQERKVGVTCRTLFGCLAVCFGIKQTFSSEHSGEVILKCENLCLNFSFNLASAA